MQVSAPELGIIPHPRRVYGYSGSGLPLEVWGAGDSPCQILLIAGIHGDETEAVVLVSEALRLVSVPELKTPVILAANPEGLLRGTRANAAGVDLNRNFPARNWSPDLVHYRSHRNKPRNIELSPGSHPASEPEVQALTALVQDLDPAAVVVMHSALACIDDPDRSSLGWWLSSQTGLPLVSGVGYPTPGSFGSWAGDRGLNLVTYELPPESIARMKASQVPVLRELLGGRYPL